MPAAPQSPWAAHAEREGSAIRLSVLLTTDPGPMRAFREFLSIDLDEAHATELLALLVLALQDLRGPANVNAGEG